MVELNMNLAMKIFSAPSVSMEEWLVMEEIYKHSKKNGWKVFDDKFGNIYVQKGELEEYEYYPVLVAHMDTVHFEHEELIDNEEVLDIRNEFGILKAYYSNTNTQTGIGGDDKAGIIIALEVLKRIDKGMCAFFRAEEIGCIGSKNLDLSVMKMGGYAIEFDAPTGSEICVHCDGIKLYDDNFLDKVLPSLNKFGFDNFVEHRPFTDVARIREQLDYNTINMGAGYHNYHSPDEYVVISEMENTISCAIEMISTLGNTFQKFGKYQLKTA
jgi:putative aminopeptidase FrvX